ncbi:MAG TPA: sigma-70 family RNA polymerase sigma factor [Dongiaceae bacterium]|nr:sigma-70 family RNA polymerase sigma factor [Dongiaceae bacterium]
MVGESRPAEVEAARFKAEVLVHLDAAANLARWLLRNPVEAEDVVQEAVLRAYAYFSSFRGVNARAWLLQIVRNTAYAALKRTQGIHMVNLQGDRDDSDARARGIDLVDPADDPETLLMRHEAERQIDDLLTQLPVELRECIVLRELQELSYREIAEITGVPIGTVMSRLWRGRRLLSETALAKEAVR